MNHGRAEKDEERHQGCTVKQVLSREEIAALLQELRGMGDCRPADPEIGLEDSPSPQAPTFASPDGGDGYPAPPPGSPLRWEDPARD